MGQPTLNLGRDSRSVKIWRGGDAGNVNWSNQGRDDQCRQSSSVLFRYLDQFGAQNAAHRHAAFIVDRQRQTRSGHSFGWSAEQFGAPAHRPTSRTPAIAGRVRTLSRQIVLPVCLHMQMDPAASRQAASSRITAITFQSDVSPAGDCAAAAAIAESLAGSTPETSHTEYA